MRSSSFEQQVVLSATVYENPIPLDVTCSVAPPFSLKRMVVAVGAKSLTSGKCLDDVI